jgi:transcriptional regulator GlxA family with amidase domain
MSTRTLNRRFREEVGTTPVHWLRIQRLRRAQYLLETTDHSIDRIAHQIGFQSTTTFRDHFNALLGTGPRAYRQAFRTST